MSDTSSNDLAKKIVQFFNSVKLAAVLLTLSALTVLIGAWCPQESTVGQDKIIQQFGVETATNLMKWGITDIFHTPYFLILIAFLTVNLTVASFQRVFPRLKLLKGPLKFLESSAVSILPTRQSAALTGNVDDVFNNLTHKLNRAGYKVERKDYRLSAEFGRWSRLAATMTHIGLLSLMVGVSITSWTGFNGFKPVKLGDSLAFADSEHSKMWIGKLPQWKVRVDATKREDYPTGEAKQWYSTLSVVDTSGKVLTTKEISVNDPLTWENVDVYQSSWGLDQILVSFNGREKALDLRPMGQRYASFLPLDGTTILIFSIKEQDKPLRLFAKRPEWTSPKLLTQIPVGGSVDLGSVTLKYIKPLPVTGLQYKCDPGLPITYVAFGFIMLGVLLAAFPHRYIWVAAQNNEAEADGNSIILHIGGSSNKAKVGFERFLEKTMLSLKNEIGEPAKIAPPEKQTEQQTEPPAKKESELIASGSKVKNNV
jgi:cytochrome c biogenesis protein